MREIRYLLDTDILIFMLRGLKNSAKSPAHRQAARRIRKRIETQIQQGRPVGLSMISACELEYGAARSLDPEKERRAVSKILAPFEVLAADPILLPRYYGEIRAQLEKDGCPIGSMDLLIAAHARSLNVTLVTNNTGEFKRIRGLQVENWAI
jgi:tRNA(fMet)-specific endonuclease VapC